MNEWNDQRLSPRGITAQDASGMHLHSLHDFLTPLRNTTLHIQQRWSLQFQGNQHKLMKEGMQVYKKQRERAHSQSPQTSNT